MDPFLDAVPQIEVKGAERACQRCFAGNDIACCPAVERTDADDHRRGRRNVSGHDRLQTGNDRAGRRQYVNAAIRMCTVTGSSFDGEAKLASSSIHITFDEFQLAAVNFWFYM